MAASPHHRRNAAGIIGCAPLLLLLWSGRAFATHTIVPDDFTYLQEALEIGGDTILVRSNVVPERVTITRSVVIEPYVFDGYGLPWTDLPVIRSMEIVQLPFDDRAVSVSCHGLRFLGDAKSTTCRGAYVFESCRFDSGFIAPCKWIELHYFIRGCLFLGDVTFAGYIQFLNNTVIGGTVSAWSDGNHQIIGNYVQGPAESGFDLQLAESSGPVAFNTVRGTQDGMRFLSRAGGASVYENEISDCSGNGIVFYSQSSSGTSAYCDSNVVQRCGGHGIAIVGGDGWYYNGSAHMSGNVIRDVGGDGIHMDSTQVSRMSRNIVIDAGGTGISVAVGLLTENIVGRCGGDGIRTNAEPGNVVRNTVFSCSGAGFHVREGYCVDTVTNNIAAFNGGPGMLYEGVHGPPQLACNDWFDNQGGAVVGMPFPVGDFELDPRFCNLGAADVHLAANSPLRSIAGCGLVGALDAGCGAVAAADLVSSISGGGLRAWPVPARGPIAFEIPVALAPTTVEVFDITGARVWQVSVPGGTTGLTWDRRVQTGQLASPGVYFARSRSNDRVMTARLILAN